MVAMPAASSTINTRRDETSCMVPVDSRLSGMEDFFASITGANAVHVVMWLFPTHGASRLGAIGIIKVDVFEMQSQALFLAARYSTNVSVRFR